MGELLVRNLDDELVQLLKIRAAQHGHSMEAEHRKILKEALIKQDREEEIPSLKALLLDMPECAEDELHRSYIMPPVEEKELISVDDFLAGEVLSGVNHEYVDGQTYVMAGGSVNHNLIGGNIYRLLGNYLLNQSCTPFMADMLLKTTQTRFRYPDVAVFCDDFAGDENYLDNPVLLVEVLSRSTRQNDKGSKLTEYLALPSLQEYMLVEQDFVEIQLLRRRNNWRLESYYLGQTVVLDSVGAELAVEDIYHKVNNGDVQEWLADQSEG